MTTLPLQNSPAVATRTRHAVLAYDGRVAGQRAMNALTQINAESPNQPFSPIPWSFDLLTELPWRVRALNDVNTADVFIVATDELDETPAAITHWISTCLNRRRGRPLFVVMLLGADEVQLQTFGADTPMSQSRPSISSPAAPAIELVA